MSFLRKCAMTAGVVCAASSASAQYYPYAAPATLAAPPAQMRQMSYQDLDAPTPAPAPPPSHYAPGSDVNGHAGGHGASHYDQALSSPEGCATCNGGTVYEGDWGCATGCGPTWYASLAALYMERNRPNPYQVSFDTTNPVGELILNIDTIDDWQWGGEVKVGRYIGCNSAVEFTYWTLDNFGGQRFAYNPAGIGSLNTPFDFRSLNFNGSPVNDWYDGAEVHRLTRSDELHNFEINFVNWPMACNPCSRFQASWLAGLRYFRFREGWEFATSEGSDQFGVDPSNEAYYNIDVENNLLGLQLGGRASYCVTQCVSLYAAPRFGVYYNYMEHHSGITSGDNQTALDVSSSRDAWSLMGQLDVGVNYQITSCLSAFAGYRVVAFTDVALADDQIPYLQDDLFGISDVDHNSTLVLHGLTAGVQLSF